MSKGCNRSFVYILIIALVGLIFVAYGAWIVNTFLDSFYKVYSPWLLPVSDNLMSCESGNC